MTERVVVVLGALLLVVPLSLLGNASSGRFVEHAGTVATAQRTGSKELAQSASAIAAPSEGTLGAPQQELDPELAFVSNGSDGFDVWTLVRRVAWSILPVGLVHATWTGQQDAFWTYQGLLLSSAWDATKGMLPSMMELAGSMPSLAAAVWNEPSLATDIGAALVMGTFDSAYAFANAKDDNDAAKIAGGVLADIWVGKMLAAAGVGGGALMAKARPAAKLSTAMRHVRSLPSKASGALARRVLPRPMTLCFVAGTPVHGAKGFVAIETLKLGDRVATTGMALAEPTAVNATWKRVELEMIHASGNVIEIALLRSPAWMEHTGATAGNTIELAIPEMNLHGTARVKTVSAAPPIAPGKGQLVLATFESTALEVVDVRFEHTSELLSATARHRLYSLDANDFVPVGALRRGERLRTREGVAVVASVAKRTAPQRVYNLEIEGDHSYFVGRVGVLSHNENPYASMGGKIPWTGRAPGIPIEPAPLRFLPFDDYDQWAGGFSTNKGEFWLLREHSNRAFEFRLLEPSEMRQLIQFDVRQFLMRAFQIDSPPAWRVEFAGRVGIAEEIWPGAGVPMKTMFDVVKQAVAYDDVQILDFIGGLRARRFDEVWLRQIEGDTFRIIPLVSERPAPPHWWSAYSDLARDFDLPIRMSDRLYVQLRTLGAQRMALREHLSVGATTTQVDDAVRDVFDKVDYVLGEADAGRMLVIQGASTHVAIDPLKRIGNSTGPEAQQFLRAHNAAVAASGRIHIPFAGLDDDEADALRRITPTRQVRDEAMAAYREAIANAYARYAGRAPQASPTSYESAEAFADAVVDRTVADRGLQLLGQLMARERAREILGIDIRDPYDNPQYQRIFERVAGPQVTGATAYETQRALGRTFFDQMAPGRRVLDELRRMSEAFWRETRR